MAGWSTPIEQLAAKAKLDVETVVQKATFDIFRAIVLRSPVDTGRFRANWNFNIGTPDFSATESTAQGRGVTEAQRALTAKVGGVVYLANGLPYARRLEFGYSRQAPAGMVRRTVAEFDAYVRKAVQS